MSRRPRRTVAQINVVPYIDVMLVLLVIFMVTTPMMQPGVINLPKVSPAERQLTERPWRIEVAADGQLKLADHGAAESIDKKALLAKLATAPNRAVVIAGDESTRYGAVLAVMQDLKRSDSGRKVGLMVDTSR